MQYDQTVLNIRLPEGQTLEQMLSRLTGYSRKRGCIPIPIEFFTELLPKLSEAELRVFLYQIYRTFGFGKKEDNIATGQFIDGVKTGDTHHDNGCGLKSKKSVTMAIRKLHEKGLVKRSHRRSTVSGDQPNHFTPQINVVTIKKPEILDEKQRGEGTQVTPQKASKKLNIQRCKKTTLQYKARHKTSIDPLHLDYLLDEIERATGDTHSRGGFARVVLSVPEDRIMELLSIIKDRGNIQNKGAWFISAARRYQSKLPQASKTIEHLEKVPKKPVRLTFIHQHRQILASKLGMPITVDQPRYDYTGKRIPICESFN